MYHLVGCVTDGAEQIVTIHALGHCLLIRLAAVADEPAQSGIRGRLLLVHWIHVQRAQPSLSNLNTHI